MCEGDKSRDEKSVGDKKAIFEKGAADLLSAAIQQLVIEKEVSYLGYLADGYTVCNGQDL